VCACIWCVCIITEYFPYLSSILTFRQQFASLLSGGTLTNEQIIKVRLSSTRDFDSALSTIATGLHLDIVNQIEECASLYGYSASNHHICLLIKSLVSLAFVVTCMYTCMYWLIIRGEPE
jgi:hypothetical protein